MYLNRRRALMLAEAREVETLRLGMSCIKQWGTLEDVQVSAGDVVSEGSLSDL